MIKEWLEDGVTIILYVFLVFVGLAMFVTILGIPYIATKTIDEKQNIYNIQTNSHEDGLFLDSASPFILWRGRYQKQEYYYFYREDDDGSKIFDKAPIKDTRIYDKLEEGETPYIEYTKREFDEEIIKAKLYVPKNTIIKQYHSSLPERTERSEK